MPQHVIVDGSNLATEGRSLPSLKQLHEAIAAYREDHPNVLMTIVVDATFGHRIDTKETAEFEKAIETNAFVAPPAGAVGRGDGFILSIAHKANAAILSNDSYQEFHGEYKWLFDEGRLIGGKPVPHVGWVFVDRLPVRGPISRRSVKEQKVVDKTPNRSRSRKPAGDRAAPAASISPSGPMPVPKSAPPGAVMPKQKQPRDAGSRVQSNSSSDPRSSDRGNDGRQGAPKSANDLLAFLSFVEHYPVGTAVTAVVENYSSHGAYVAIGDAKGYVPLRLMADPAPRSAREVMAIGETVTLVVNSFGPSRRSIDLAVPAMAPPPPPIAPPKVRRAAGKAAADKAAASKAAASKVAMSAAKEVEPDGVAAEAIATEALETAASLETPSRPAKAASRTRSKGSKQTEPNATPGPAAAPKPKRGSTPRSKSAAPRAEPAAADVASAAMVPGARATGARASTRSGSKRSRVAGAAVAPEVPPPATTFDSVFGAADTAPDPEPKQRPKRRKPAAAPTTATAAAPAAAGGRRRRSEGGERS